jgi:2-polyprenyl-3-methyl-5-hydroxy-6-metoxy-1,4-benzoquinol methylase
MNGVADVRYVAVTSCYLCGGAVSRERAWIEDVVDYESKTGTYDILYCERCELGLTDPMPTPETVGFLYAAKDSVDFDEVRGTPIDRLKDALAVRFLHSLPLETAPKACLDFGAGNGRFAHAMQQAFPGADVYAADLDDDVPEKSYFQMGLRKLSYERLFEGATSFDLIVVRHVAEHMHDPVAMLGKLYDLLTPTGILYVEVPNLRSIMAKIFRRKWVFHYVPRHISHFTESSLRRLMSLAAPHAKVTLGKSELPLFSPMIAILLGLPNNQSIAIKAAGAALHPLQLVAEKLGKQSTCLYAIAFGTARSS